MYAVSGFVHLGLLELISLPMDNPFFTRPILNSPYDPPMRHWELDPLGQPTQTIKESRRPAEFITPIPKSKKGSPKQSSLNLNPEQLAAENQRYILSSLINDLRFQVEKWRLIPDPANWNVTPETARLLTHWRHYKFSGPRPFFCQLEAVETVIWLTEVAPKLGATSQRFLNDLDSANHEANPGLARLALKLATGAGKTTVMAMIIAWQTINAARRSTSSRFTRSFLIVTPGLTIKDRLRVLLPNDPNSYFTTRELVPPEFLPELGKARIVITNYHAFKLRERLELSKGNRQFLEGRDGHIESLETPGQMIQRVIPELMNAKNIMVLNDEAHHCYRQKPASIEEEDPLTGDEREEAENRNKAARLWISGLELIQQHLGLSRIIDLSATPFFLRGSGYVEGTLFPWTMSNFSLMDAIECGIVKLPRVPVADNIPGAEVPIFRNLWEHIRPDMPRKRRSKDDDLDPLKLPAKLQTALEALYGHYRLVYDEWQKSGIKVPPVLIVVCQNTSASKLVYDYISGFVRKNPDKTETLVPGRLELFRNQDENGTPFARPKTLLIDSEQLESGDALDDNFRKIAGPEIEQFKREILERTGDRSAAENISDSQLLREVMNTVGRQGSLGESIRCVVSVSMLTEGWDANTVTHVLGVRAFGTQLLCEQVIGRALRRQSYHLNEEGLFDVEYADVLGIPFDFTVTPQPAPPKPPPQTVQVRAIRPERDHLEIRFPRVSGYRVELPDTRLQANFTADSTLPLTPSLIGPSHTRNSGIIGESVDLNLAHTRDLRQSTLLMHLTKHLILTQFRDQGGEPEIHLFGQLKPIVRQWLDNHLVCQGDTYPAQLLYSDLAQMACERIAAAITRAHLDTRPIRAVVDPYNPVGSTTHVRFNTSRTTLWETLSSHCHINYVVYDSEWEAEFCRVLESHPKVLAYAKNHALGFEVPYLLAGNPHKYLPDFIIQIDSGNPEAPLNLIIEIKGFRGEDAKQKKETMDTYWIPGVNHLGTHGRWAFAEFGAPFSMEADLNAKITREFDALISSVTPKWNPS